MYKKYLTLALNQEKKVICRIPFVEDKCQIEVKVLLEEELLDLSGLTVKIGTTIIKDRKLFKSYQMISTKTGQISVEIMNDIADVDIRIPCELKVYNAGQLLGSASFYLVFFDPLMMNNRKKEVTDVKKAPTSAQVRMIAHRGLSLLAPENTLPAYELAGKYGYYGAECDIHETKDGEFILLHDDLLNRTTTGSGKPERYSLEELKEFFVNDGHQIKKYPNLKIPTLQEFLIVCKRWGLLPVIEIKEMEPNSVFQLLRLIRNFGDLNQVMIISFSKEIVTEVRKQSDDIQIQWLADLTHENIDYCANYQMGIDSYKKKVSKEMIEYAHSKGVVVNTWTVDSGEQMQDLIEMGIDFISTNILMHRQVLRSGGKIKSYFLNNRVSYITCLHPSINNEGANQWKWHTSGILEIKGDHEAKKMLQMKLPAMHIGDVVSLSFFYRHISGDEVGVALEYIESEGSSLIERRIKTEPIDDWRFVECQFIVLHDVSGIKDYYNILIGSWQMSSSHFMIQDVRVKVDYM